KDSVVYYNGYRMGLSLSWFENGKISDSTFFNSDGSGYNKGWFENGNLSYETKYIEKRILDGQWKYYHRSGKLSEIEVYDKGKLIEKKYFDENGNPMYD